MYLDGCPRRDPSESLHDRGKFSSGLVQGACVAPHQLPDHVNEPEDHIDECRRHLHAAIADRAHIVFDVMGEVADGFEADGVGRPLQGVGGPEELLDGVRVLRAGRQELVWRTVGGEGLRCRFHMGVSGLPRFNRWLVFRAQASNGFDLRP